jgi:formate dehydrogenase accessory protein FdhE
MASGMIESLAGRKNRKLQATGIRGSVDINKKILKKLEEWQHKEGPLPQYLELYRQLLSIQVEAKASVPSPRLATAKADIEDAMKKGIPLLKWDALSIDWAAFHKLLQSALAVISENTNQTDKCLKNIASDITQLQKMAEAWFEGSSLSPWSNSQGIDEDILSVAIHCAIKPFLATQAKALIGQVSQEQWRHGYCPICRGKPDFAYLDKERGARWLICSRCDSEWLFQRLECPYCGTKDHTELSYFTDEKEMYRLYICKRCRSYLKTIDLRKTETEVLLPLERVMTVDLDRQGQEKGYKGG